MTICSASIKANIDFFFEVFNLARWFMYEKVVYDDGSYPDKIRMYQQACHHLGLDPAMCVSMRMPLQDSKCPSRRDRTNSGHLT